MHRKVCDQCENFQRQQNHGKWMCELKSEANNKTENGSLVHNWIDSDQFGVKCDLECNFEEVNNPLQGVEIQCIEYKDTGDLFWQLKVLSETIFSSSYDEFYRPRTQSLSLSINLKLKNLFAEKQ